MDPRSTLNDILQLSSHVGTFASIDVVASTQIKTGEQEQDIIYTFLSYHKLVSEAAYEFHGTVITISGDGMMCRFERPEDATQAALSILARLPAFNKRQNRLRNPLGLRLGVHTGEVKETQQGAGGGGQIISQTLDIAAKLQQSSPTNRARFSEATISLLGANAPKVTRLGWDAKLSVNVFEYAGTRATSAPARVLPDPLRVMVVEQELDELLRLKKVLWVRRHVTIATYDLNQAALCSQTWKPHVILVSADLPWGNGWELVKALRADVASSTVPVVMMSRNATGETIEKCFKSGGNGCINKPLEEVQIVKRLDNVLREFYL